MLPLPILTLEGFEVESDQQAKCLWGQSILVNVPDVHIKAFLGLIKCLLADSFG